MSATDTYWTPVAQPPAPHETPEAQASYAEDAHAAIWPRITRARQQRDRAMVFIELVRLVEHQAACYGVTGITIPAADRFRRLGSEDRARRAAERATRLEVVR